MILWHVTTVKKLERYKKSGGILPPVRGWASMEAAHRFSVQTGRRIILRLKWNQSFQLLNGHKHQAWVSEEKYEMKDF